MFFYPDAEHLRKQYQYTLHALPVDKWEVLLTYHPPLYQTAPVLLVLPRAQ
jgi:hypothetical protein